MWELGGWECEYFYEYFKRILLNYEFSSDAFIIRDSSRDSCFVRLIRIWCHRLSEHQIALVILKLAACRPIQTQFNWSRRRLLDTFSQLYNAINHSQNHNSIRKIYLWRNWWKLHHQKHAKHIVTTFLHSSFIGKLHNILCDRRWLKIQQIHTQKQQKNGFCVWVTCKALNLIFN